MILRAANLEDVPQLTDLLDQLGYPMSPAAVQDNLHAYLRDPDRAVLVAEVNGKIAGCLALDIARTFHREANQMRIVSLVIDRDYRRKGIGKLLLAKAEERAKKEGCWIIEVTSAARRKKDGTHAFYEHQGYGNDTSELFFYKTIA